MLLSRAMIRKLTDWAVPNGLAALAFVVGAWGGQRLPAALIAGIALVYLVWKHRQAAAMEYVTARVLLAAVLLTQYAAAVPMPDLPLVVTGGVLLLLLLGEPLLSRVSRPLFRTAHLGDTPTWSQRVFDRRTAALATTGVIICLVPFVAGAWPTWPLLLLVVVPVVVSAGTLLRAVQVRMLGRAAALAELQQWVSDYRPTFLVYFTAPPGSTYQIMMWLPHFEQLGERFMVVMREQNAFEAVAAATDAPVLYCPEMSTFDACIVPSLGAVFYVNNGAKNTHSVRYGHLTHIFLNHGDSDKVTSFNPITAMYDRVFVAGQAGIDRYLNHGVDIAPHKFRIVGRPQVASVQRATGPIGQVEQPVVLYAPTWTGHYADANYCSLPMAEGIVRSLLARGATVILRHHPYTTRDRAAAAQLRAAHQLLAADAAVSGRAHLWGPAATDELSLIDCFNRSDALISDVSSVASEYLYSEKPFAITDVAGLGDGFAEVFSLAKVAYVIDRGCGNLDEVLDRLLVADPGRAERVAARSHYLGDFPPESYAEAFLTEARSYLRPAVTPVIPRQVNNEPLVATNRDTAG